jgi:hypothetical protein
MEIQLGDEALLNVTMAEAVEKYGLQKSPIAARVRQTDTRQIALPLL